MPDDLFLRPRDSTYPTTEGFGLSGGQSEGVDLPDWLEEPTAEVTIDEDGGVTIAAPAVHRRPEKTTPATFNDNLAKSMNDGDLAQLASEIREGIESDLRSRDKFVQNLTTGVDLLGLEIRQESQTKSTKRNISTVQHPVLLEAITKAQSRARPELFPSDGPCKVTTRGSMSGKATDELAASLQADMNWYLTTGAREYYADGDRGLFGFFFSGNWFKKVYEHPLWHRPTSQSIGIEDFIVSQDAVDLDTAVRMTHRNSDMAAATVKRMMHFGGWRNIELSQAVATIDPYKQKMSSVLGLSPVSVRPQDIPRTIDETITDLDLGYYGHLEAGVPDGLPVSYAVTMDWDSFQILDIRRRWRFGDKEFQRRHPYVHFGMIPAFDFLALGYVHLLGNSAKALTAIWRLLCDSGMFANFPGGVKAKSMRLGSNELQPSPGEWVDADITGMDDIRKAFLPMPYKDVSPGLMQLVDKIASDVQRLGGTVELDVGEGRTNIPVGTMLAMVEQATQTMAAVHKRMHSAQARELLLLKECFADNPEALWKLNPDPARQWQTREEFENLDLVPASDPNVPAQIHRLMIALAMVTMSGQNPDIYDRVETHLRAWRMLGVKDADEFVRQPPPQGGEDPAATAAKTALATKQMDVAFKSQENQRKAATEAVENQQQAEKLRVDAASDAADRASKEKIETMKVQTEHMRLQAEEMRSRRQEAQAERHHTMGLFTKGGLMGGGTDGD